VNERDVDIAGRGRPRLDPDPQVREAILVAALAIVREEGVRALGISQVLARAQLGTRAFYRHFDSKDQLVAALFLDMARIEMQRLRERMAGHDPVRAVAAWIDGRLDLAFDPQIRSDLRQLSLEAQSQMFAAPELVGPAYSEILHPLIDEIDRGKRLGLFGDVDPAAEALSIQGVVWANVERQWATGTSDRAATRRRIQRFCLSGLGVAAGTVADIIGARPKPSGPKKPVRRKRSS
jgi:AcrR family transcriptional regulator